MPAVGVELLESLNVIDSPSAAGVDTKDDIQHYSFAVVVSVSLRVEGLDVVALCRDGLHVKFAFEGMGAMHHLDRCQS